MNTVKLLGDWPLEVFLVVPLAPGADEEPVRALFPGRERATQRLGNVLLIGRSEAIQRVPGMQPDLRPELAAAFTAAGDTAAQLLLLPPTYSRRVLEESLPEAPEELGGGTIRVFTRGLLWAAVGFDTPPQATLRLVVQSEDAEAAEAFRTKLVELLRLAGQLKQVQKYLPKFDEAVTVLAPDVEGDRITLTLNRENQGLPKALSVLVPPAEILRIHFGRYRSVDNLKKMGLAMHRYYDVNSHFPLPASYSKDKKPLLSWRVHILPYVDQRELYDQFHLEEPWDSPHNLALADKMPDVYRMPGSKHKEKGRTNYVVPVGNGAAFSANKPTKIQDIKDGTSNTIMIVEVDDEHAVLWTKPDDLPFDPKQPAQGLNRLYDGGFNTVFCDGAVHFLKLPEIGDRLPKLFTRAGGEVVELH